MTPALSDDLKMRIVSWYFEDGLTYREICDRANCSIGLISKVMSNYSVHGRVTNPFSKRTGRPTKIQDGDVEYISSLIEANPVLYLDEIQHRLLSTRGVGMSIASLSRLLIQYGLTRKHIQKAAAERDEELRTIWEADMAQYTDPDVFVALDESAVDNKTLQREYGRSLVGSPCVRRATFLRGVRYSILPALTTEGIVALDIFEGSVTKERFLTFIHEQIVCSLLF
jgi:transposase